ncbi:MAG: flavodoxin family protein [Clostridia bacterium]|nr:flavodoxin family protein [Clostridia bacterium]
MRTLVLNGSPKREKSDTMHITRAFLDGMAEAAAQEVRIIHVIDRHIEYCTGCFSCMRGGGECVHRDDMRAILEAILDSDLLVLSFPLYCYGMPAPLKALLDRTLPLSSMAMRRVGERYEHVAQADFSRLRYLMICGCGFPNSRQNFEPAVTQFKLCFPRNHTILTVPESPMFSAPEAAVVTAPRLELIRRAGRQYAREGTVDAALLAGITSPMIPEAQYAAIVNGGAPQQPNQNE